MKYTNNDTNTHVYGLRPRLFLCHVRVVLLVNSYGGYLDIDLRNKHCKIVVHYIPILFRRFFRFAWFG